MESGSQTAFGRFPNCYGVTVNLGWYEYWLPGYTHQPSFHID